MKKVRPPLYRGSGGSTRRKFNCPKEKKRDKALIPPRENSILCLHDATSKGVAKLMGTAIMKVSKKEKKRKNERGSSGLGIRSSLTIWGNETRTSGKYNFLFVKATGEGKKAEARRRTSGKRLQAHKVANIRSQKGCRSSVMPARREGGQGELKRSMLDRGGEGKKTKKTWGCDEPLGGSKQGVQRRFGNSRVKLSQGARARARLGRGPNIMGGDARSLDRPERREEGLEEKEE